MVYLSGKTAVTPIELFSTQIRYAFAGGYEMLQATVNGFADLRVAISPARGAEENLGETIDG